MLAKNKILLISIYFLTFCTCVYIICVSRFDASNLQPLMEMNDVPQIIDGYRKTPHLLVDGLRWWHGAWIETGIGAYRPLSSYLLWIETYIVLHYGFAPIVAIGGMLLLVISVACSLISWQLTRSYWLAGFSGVLSTYVATFNYGGIDTNWIAWYPVHHDLLNIIFALFTVWAFLRYVECGGKMDIILCYAFFIAGIFTKEYLYIFPVMALAIALLYKSTFTPRKKLLIHPALMLIAVIGFYIFRQSVITTPYTPHALTWHMLITHSLLFWFHAFYLYLPISSYFIPALALMIFGAALLTKYHNKYLNVTSIVIILAYAQLFYGIDNLFWYFVDGEVAKTHTSLFIQMLFTFYTFYLCYKYRKTHNGILAYTLMIVAYLPTFTYLGWHYSLTGWFFRSAIFWAVIVGMVYEHISVKLKLNKFLFPIKARSLPSR